MMHGQEKSDSVVVCAEQRVVQEGSSPSGARMRGAISESGGNASLAEEERKVWRSLHGHEGESRRQPRRTCSHRSVGTSEGRVSTARWNPKGMRRSTGSQSMELSDDEAVGQRWGKVEPALWRRRRSHSPTAPRCLHTTRYGRTMRDPRRTGVVRGWHRGKRAYKRERSGKRCCISSRTAE